MSGDDDNRRPPGQLAARSLEEIYEQSILRHLDTRQGLKDAHKMVSLASRRDVDLSHVACEGIGRLRRQPHGEFLLRDDMVGVGIEVKAKKTQQLYGIKLDLDMDLLKEDIRPRYNYDSGKICYGKAETDADMFFLYNTSD